MEHSLSKQWRPVASDLEYRTEISSQGRCLRLSGGGGGVEDVQNVHWDTYTVNSEIFARVLFRICDVS